MSWDRSPAERSAAGTIAASVRTSSKGPSRRRIGTGAPPISLTPRCKASTRSDGTYFDVRVGGLGHVLQRVAQAGGGHLGREVGAEAHLEERRAGDCRLVGPGLQRDHVSAQFL